MHVCIVQRRTDQTTSTGRAKLSAGRNLHSARRQSRLLRFGHISVKIGWHAQTFSPSIWLIFE